MDIQERFILFVFAFAVILIAMTQRLIMNIRRDDENLYAKLGRPDLFRNNNLATVYAFWKWIYFGEPNETSSIESKRITVILRISVIVYALIILLYFGYIFHEFATN